MHGIRVTLAVLISFAVAVIPAAAGGAAVSENSAMIVSAADASAMPCHDTVPDDCKNVAICVLKCFNYVGVELSASALPRSGVSIERRFVQPAIIAHIDSPPTRPPQA
jgi:hypothetical protein